MLNEISSYIKNQINYFSNDDSLIFNNKVIDINLDNFSSLGINNGKSIAFIDGGQAEIISSGNFCLSFIRVAAIIFNNGNKKNIIKEFYLFTKSKFIDNDLFYESKIFGDELINENDLLISSKDSSIKVGSERAPINKVSNMARRFAELSMANKLNVDFIEDYDLGLAYPLPIFSRLLNKFSFFLPNIPVGQFICLFSTQTKKSKENSR